MSSQEAVCIRFPSGSIEFTFSGDEIKVGDRLVRGDQEWEVIAVERDASDHAVVTLAPPGDGKVRPSAAPREESS